MVFKVALLSCEPTMACNGGVEEGIAMLLGDKDIRKLIGDGVLEEAEADNIGPVSYDLQTQDFYRDGKSSKSVTLNPGDSVFVSSVECIRLPNDVAARVLIKNSRLRQGLTLDAPLYFPGHKTRLFFRVTNISADLISLDTDKGIAQIVFEQVDGVGQPYDGAFSNEFSFRGLASYTDIYKTEIEEINQKKDELKSMEHRLYANILALMAVFAALFTLVNVNVNALGAGPAGIVTANLMVLGGFSFLAGVIGLLVGADSSKKKSAVVLVAGLVLVVVGFFLAILV